MLCRAYGVRVGAHGVRVGVVARVFAGVVAHGIPGGNDSRWRSCWLLACWWMRGRGLPGGVSHGFIGLGAV